MEYMFFWFPKKWQFSGFLKKDNSYIIHKPSKACFALCCASQNLFFFHLSGKPGKKKREKIISGFQKVNFDPIKVTHYRCFLQWVYSLKKMSILIPSKDYTLSLISDLGCDLYHQYNTYGLDNIGNKYLFPIKRVDFYAKKYREFDFLMYFCRKFYTNTLTMTSTMRDFMKILHGFFVFGTC